MKPLSLLLAALSAILPFASAIRMFESNSLNPCMANSSFSATFFSVLFTPDNQTLSINMNGVSEISGNVYLEIKVLGYGYVFYHNKIDPCKDETLKGLCPMNQGDINFPSNAQLPQSTINQVPNAIYYIPDIDGVVQIWINSTSGTPLACVEADLSNGKTVYQKGVAWTFAVIAGSGLVISAIVSGLGHSNTAAHVAANALSLFGYFQAQAMIGMVAVEMPPVVRAWTQNFQWSMGIIRVGFLQRLATWYQRSTGGTPSTYLSSLATTSVQVAKRSLTRRSVHAVHEFSKRNILTSLVKRTNSQTTNAENLKTVVVRGIERVGFKARIEITNIFMTGYIFFLIFVFSTVMGVVLFKYACEALAKSGKMSSDKFRDFRNGWRTVLKGILYRIALIGFPQMCVLCFWELTKRDSAAEVVLAVSTIGTLLVILAWAGLKVWRIARRSINLHKNPAYILYSDPKALNKWGFLYVQFKATMYYFIIPTLLYILVKSMFIGFAQKAATAQAIALVILEAALLITISIMRPYMDKKTNGFNIAIAAVNFFNVILLLFFSDIFNVPSLAIGIMGLIFFFVNVIFATVILFMVIWSSVRALVSKNPDTRYQPMRDDRGSFIKSQTNLGTTELDALGATARGDKLSGYNTERKRTAIDDDDDESFTSSDVYALGNVQSQSNLSSPATQGMGYGAARSPIEPPSAPMMKSNDQLGGPPSYRSQSPAQSGFSAPGAYGGYQGYQGGSPYRAPSQRPGGNVQAYRQQNNASPWQRGVGY